MEEIIEKIGKREWKGNLKPTFFTKSTLGMICYLSWYITFNLEFMSWDETI